jgi:hypothetical protein
MLCHEKSGNHVSSFSAGKTNFLRCTFLEQTRGVDFVRTIFVRMCGPMHKNLNNNQFFGAFFEATVECDLSEPNAIWSQSYDFRIYNYNAGVVVGRLERSSK